MIVIVDYGMGNLRSAQKGFERGGFEAVISDNPKDIADAAGVVLPGVGAFKDCFTGLAERGFVDPLLEHARAAKPLLGICVGMQLLFDYGEEGEGSRGLGILPGRVVRFPQDMDHGLKVPHMGWNTVDLVPGRPCPLFKYTSRSPYVYFVHSYYPVPATSDLVYATTEYGVRFASVVGRGAVFGAQFHPEKSQQEGIGILRAFGEIVMASAPSVTL
jgi:glutamine amidotransferase